MILRPSGCGKPITIILYVLIPLHQTPAASPVPQRFGTVALLNTTSRSENWIHDFQIPQPCTFSTPTMKFLLVDEQGVLTKAMRIEIITVLTTQVMLHTRYPTSTEYTTVCRMLIEKYPHLSDIIGNGYVSLHLRCM